MKKTTALLLIVFMLALTATCALGEAVTAEVWKRMDGSTATIPLSEALMAHFLGLPPEETSGKVSHSRTHWAYRAFAEPDEDEAYPPALLLVSAPSEGEITYLRMKDVPYRLVPIAKDALVFINNAQNPVSDLSIDQLRAIYTGEILNWYDVGGNDTEIVPYQRNLTSGSQTLFNTLLMQGLPAMQPPKDWILGEMSYVIQRVASYENGPAALGYSVFYYVNNMYPNDQLRILSVNGVTPSSESVAAGEYPLCTYYYALIRDDLPKDDPLNMMLDFLLSDEGQRLAALAGYIPLELLEEME